MLDERVGRQLPGAHVGVLLVGVFPVVVPLQGARDVARVVAVGAAERLQGQGGGLGPGQPPCHRAPARRRRPSSPPVLLHDSPTCECPLPGRPGRGQPPAGKRARKRGQPGAAESCLCRDRPSHLAGAPRVGGVSAKGGCSDFFSLLPTPDLQFLFKKKITKSNPGIYHFSFLF